MMTKNLFNTLQLAYCPLCNRDFAILKDQTLIQDILDESSVYIICQRPELEFKNIEWKDDGRLISFEIHQKNRAEVLYCSMPVYQKELRTKGLTVTVGMEYNPHKIFGNNLNDVYAMSFYLKERNEDYFPFWLTPEKFFYDYWRQNIVVEIKGDIKDFTRYTVLYVGQSVRQDIWERLTGHKTLQEILSLETPLSYGSIPTNEILLLFVSFKDAEEVINWGDVSPEEASKKLQDHNENQRPDLSTVFLDLEKALIKALKPKYNKALFKNYPKSIDGLYKYGYSFIVYSFLDPIVLLYQDGSITGNMEFKERDLLVITANRQLELVRQRNQPG